MTNYIYKNNSDLITILLNKYAYNLSLLFNSLLSSIVCLIIMKLKGIIFGQNCKFYGFTKFYRSVGTSIRIGNNCGFRSKATSNLIGINRPCIISTLLHGAQIIIGDDCGFSGTVIGAFTKITIRNNVRCGANTLITDADWHLDDPRSGTPKPIVIEKNVWLGEGVKVLKGVTIGENAVIGAGSVVTKDIPANVIAGGNPCRVIKKGIRIE